MNYIKLINQFWQLRRSKRITNLQSDLYYFLMQECNSRNWENPFQCSNGLICTSIGITEKSLIDARNVLQQFGLIEVEPGITKQKSPTYYLSNYCNKVSNPVSNRGSNQRSNQGGNQLSNQGYIYTKQNKKETKLNNSFSASAPPVAETGNKKKEESFPHWKKLVETWICFYEKQFQQEPTFTGATATALKSICQRIKKLGNAKGAEWTEQYAVRCLNHFFEKAYQDDWLRANFLLTNLSTKYDSIVNTNKIHNGNTTPRSIKAISADIDYGSAI